MTVDVPFAGIFQSTLPRGSDVIDDRMSKLDPVISIHAPSRERRPARLLS